MMEPSPPARVLVVDDEVEFGATLAKVLRRRGLQVQVANDGDQARDALERFVFDVVVLDVKMPRLGGEGLMAEVARRRPGTPVILMTGHLAAGGSDEALERGAFAFLLKPHPIPDLLELIGRAAAHARKTKE